MEDFLHGGLLHGLGCPRGAGLEEPDGGENLCRGAQTSILPVENAGAALCRRAKVKIGAARVLAKAPGRQIPGSSSPDSKLPT